MHRLSTPLHKKLFCGTFTPFAHADSFDYNHQNRQKLFTTHNFLLMTNYNRYLY